MVLTSTFDSHPYTTWEPYSIVCSIISGEIIIHDGNITLTSNQEVGETVFTIKPISTHSRVLMVESSKYFDLYNCKSEYYAVELQWLER